MIVVILIALFLIKKKKPPKSEKKAGKESKLYWGKDKEGNNLAIKIFLTVSAEFKKGMLIYIQGDPRFTRVKRDTRSLIYLWAQKEFKNLHTAFKYINNFYIHPEIDTRIDKGD